MDLYRIIKKLKEYDGVRIAEKELREFASVDDYDEYYNVVTLLVNSNIITPVISSGSNGMRPALYKRYAVIKTECNYDELIPEIRLLHSKLNIEGYLADPQKYKNHRYWLSLLDSFLKNTKDKEVPLSINERSFQIFKKEKALKEDRELAAVLNFNAGIRETLNYYITPEPFFTYNVSPWDIDGKHDLNILIIENKDTWYTLRSRMSPSHSFITDIHFDCLIYGEGKKVSRKSDSLTEFDKGFFEGKHTHYYYFGDLDYEGIGIFYDLIEINPLLDIRIMKPLYTTMLELSRNIELPYTKEKQHKNHVGWFISLFDAEYQSVITNTLDFGRYIPQEILNNTYFIKAIGCSREA